MKTGELLFLSGNIQDFLAGGFAEVYGLSKLGLKSIEVFGYPVLLEYFGELHQTAGKPERSPLARRNLIGSAISGISRTTRRILSKSSGLSFGSEVFKQIRDRIPFIEFACIKRNTARRLRPYPYRGQYSTASKPLFHFPLRGLV